MIVYMGYIGPIQAERYCLRTKTESYDLLLSENPPCLTEVSRAIVAFCRRTLSKGVTDVEFSN